MVFILSKNVKALRRTKKTTNLFPLTNCRRHLKQTSFFSFQDYFIVSFPSLIKDLTLSEASHAVGLALKLIKEFVPEDAKDAVAGLDPSVVGQVRS